MQRKTPIVVGAVTALMLWAAPAGAHVTVSPEHAPEDGFTTLVFQVPHGCDGHATTDIAVQIPPGVVSVTPQVKPGWEITVTEGTLPQPVDYFGQALTEGVVSVAWTGGSLDDRFMDQFAMSVKLPPGAGDTLYFPVVQTCTEGESAWIQVPAAGEPAHDLEAPAPALVLTTGQSGHGNGGGEATASAQAPTDILVVLALVAGGLGVAMGGTALLQGRRRR